MVYEELPCLYAEASNERGDPALDLRSDFASDWLIYGAMSLHSQASAASEAGDAPNAQQRIKMIQERSSATCRIRQLGSISPASIHLSMRDDEIDKLLVGGVKEVKVLAYKL